MRKGILIAVLLVVILPIAAFAQEDRTLSPYFLVLSDDPAVDQLPEDKAKALIAKAKAEGAPVDAMTATRLARDGEGRLWLGTWRGLWVATGAGLESPPGLPSAPVVDLVVDVFEADRAFLMLVDPDTGELRFQVERPVGAEIAARFLREIIDSLSRVGI